MFVSIRLSLHHQQTKKKRFFLQIWVRGTAMEKTNPSFTFFQGNTKICSFLIHFNFCRSGHKQKSRVTVFTLGNIIIIFVLILQMVKYLLHACRKTMVYHFLFLSTFFYSSCKKKDLSCFKVSGWYILTLTLCVPGKLHGIWMTIQISQVPFLQACTVWTLLCYKALPSVLFLHILFTVSRQKTKEILPTTGAQS